MYVRKIREILVDMEELVGIIAEEVLAIIGSDTM
jgi:hypothetical protein